MRLLPLPPARHPCWTAQTLKDLAVRYPRLDIRQWQRQHYQAWTRYA
jgi:hypothetical protein